MSKLVPLLALLVVSALGPVACGGGDDGGTTAAAQNGTLGEPFSDEERIEQAGNRWAVAFAKEGPVACRSMGQPACELANCEPVAGGPIENCTPPSTEFRESFADATVEGVTIEGTRATAQFSNGESVTFEGLRSNREKESGVDHRTWFITEEWVKNVEQNLTRGSPSH